MDGDSVTAAVCVTASRDDDGIEQVENGQFLATSADLPGLVARGRGCCLRRAGHERVVVVSGRQGRSTGSPIAAAAWAMRPS